MKTLMLFALMVFSGAAAQAQGDRIGNGGLGVAYYDGTRSITRLMLLDTYEYDFDGRFELGFENASQEKILRKVHNRLSSHPEFRKKYDEMMKVVADAYHVEGSNAPERNSTLPASNDHGFYFFGQSAALVQVANMTSDNQRLLINDRYYQLLSTRDRAALSVHEAVYAVERETSGATTSVHARKIVRALLAKKFDQNRLTKLLAEIGY